ncbi:MAG: hypothetical protein RIC19_08070 [Phaeodactylibacter sp.]|uniref:hypothetical protein n=1 Tax=Phaeodactylibacter sp. TaxID=1940289 RepID=UPI0032ED15F1
MLQLPDHLTEKQKQVYRKRWLGTVSLIVQTVSAIFFAVVGLFLFALFQPSLVGWFGHPEPVALESVQQRMAEKESDLDRVENGIHLETGLIAAEGWEVVRGTCTACHSAKLVTQNKATRDGWKNMIVWMQETQGLWDLGDQEKTILDYLAAHYAPEEASRRANLDIDAIEWYILDL